MTDRVAEDQTGRRNLRRLFALRSLMIGAYLLGWGGVVWLLDVHLPVLPMAGVIGLLVVANVWTWRRTRRGQAIGHWEFFAQLGIDTLGLAAVLYLSGGATNPFAWLFLLPLMIAATVLPGYMVWAMAALAIACYSLLMFRFVPFGGVHAHHDQSFAQHVFGMWFGFIMSALLVAWFVVGMASTLRRRDRLLAQAREQCLRDEQLVALGTLATGAAHELGTPLATMAVLTRELERADVDDATRHRLKILRAQIERCKQALSVISASAGETRAEGGGLARIPVFVDEVLAEWRRQRLDARISVETEAGPDTDRILDEHTLHQSLINLLNNAADASRDALTLKVSWDDRRLSLEILDRGPGLHPAPTAGPPRPRASAKEYGMGLGLFLTHATLQRLGGEIALFEREAGGTRTRIQLPLVAGQRS